MTPLPPRQAGTLATAIGVTTPAVAGLATFLLLADAVLILLHLSQKIVGQPSGTAFDLGLDRGYGEFFNYLKMLWAASAFLLLAARTQTLVYGAWALLCLHLLADDWFQLHEKFGFAFADRFPGLGSLASHLGELVWVGGVGVVIGTVLLLAHRRSGPEHRAVTVVLVLLFGAFALFGVAVDAVHHVVLDLPALEVPLTTLEDGGELVTMSLTLTFLFAVAFTDHRPRLGMRLASLGGVARGR